MPQVEAVGLDCDVNRAWRKSHTSDSPGYQNPGLTIRDRGGGDTLVYADPVDDLQPGVYRHFKGARYEVVGLARHSETEETLVVYRPLAGDRSLWVRPLAMWSEPVDRDGYRGPRFVRETATD